MDELSCLAIPAFDYAIGMAYEYVSLVNPSGSSSMSAAIGWIEGVALGDVATGVATLAVATMGLLLLTGRVELRRGASVLLGCFIVFGARNIASAFHSDGDAPPRYAQQVTASPLENFQPPPAQVYDPYAGAAVPSR